MSPFPGEREWLERHRVGTAAAARRPAPTMTVTVIEPDGSVWLATLPSHQIGREFFRIDDDERVALLRASPADFDKRLDPDVAVKTIRYISHELKTRSGRSHWIYVPDV